MFQRMFKEEIKMNTFEFETVVKESSASENLHKTFREAMFNIVLMNTIKRGIHVTPDYLVVMKESFTEFVVSNTVKIEKFSDDCNKVSEFDFKNKNEWIREAILLCNFLNENDIWFEDTLGNGFCCSDSVEDDYFHIIHD